MIVPRYYENLSVLHENTMPARAYYIPALVVLLDKSVQTSPQFFQ